MGKKKLKILIIGDGDIQVDSIASYLRTSLHNVTVVSSDIEVCAKIDNIRPEIILSKFESSSTAFELCKAMQLKNTLHQYYLIFLCRPEDMPTMPKLLNAGANDFILVRPLNYSELNARITNAERILELLRMHVEQTKIIQQKAFEFEATATSLQLMCITDPLTGLYNRRYVNTRLDQEWSNFRRGTSDFAIITLDIDHFKSVNDDYGHSLGDEVLVHIAKILQNTVRTSDIACRMGGEEFIVIMPDANLESILILGERLRAAIEREQPSGLHIKQTITVSVGAAISISNLIDWKELIEQSDKAMYKAKHSGRNCFRMYNVSN